MLKHVTLYYFSPTGGTKRTGEILCKSLAEETKYVNLAVKDKAIEPLDSDVAVLAAPVFGGRIPAVAIDRIRKIDGEGKRAVTVAVYGTRAYEDALLELNNTAEECGFEVLGSAALIAEHSMVRSVGAGRPDEKDADEIAEFATKLIEKIEANTASSVEVPGDFPYKDHMEVKATPICLPECTACGVCAEICPTGAIEIKDGAVETSLAKCNLCLACTAHCPEKCRVLAPPMQEALNQKLGPLEGVRRDNEFFC